MKNFFFAAILLCSLFLFAKARFASINVNLAMTVSEDSHKLSEDMVRICAEDTKISMQELQKFHKNDFSNPSEATQCFAHCIYEQMGLIRDGVFVNRDVLRTLADVTDPNYLIAKECHGIKDANKCEMAYKIHKCRHEHGIVHHLPNNVGSQPQQPQAPQPHPPQMQPPQMQPAQPQPQPETGFDQFPMDNSDDMMQ